MRAVPKICRLLAAIAVMFAASATAAQSIQTIAAIVNDAIISGYDVEQRINLVIRATRLSDTEETRTRLRRQVLTALVDEHLQRQEAERNNIELTPDDLARAFETVAQQNSVRIEDFDTHLQAQGISKDALTEQLSAEILWGKLVRRKLVPKVSIGEEEIDEVLANLTANIGKTEYRLQEIFIPVPDPDSDGAIVQGLERLVQQLRAGADFVAAARQFSRAATAAQGGDVGWVLAENLVADVAERIRALDTGGITDPIPSIGGYRIYRLRDRRQLLTEDPNATKVTLNQLYWTVNDTVSDSAEVAAAEAQAASEQITGCETLTDVASEQNWPEVVDLGELTMGDLPDNIRAAIGPLQVGDASVPIALDQDLMVLVVCDRQAQEVSLPERGQIQDELTRRRVAILAFRYLRDLRQSAAIEYR